jgi:hypothetical protein
MNSFSLVEFRYAKHIAKLPKLHEPRKVFDMGLEGGSVAGKSLLGMGRSTGMKPISLFSILGRRGKC